MSDGLYAHDLSVAGGRRQAQVTRDDRASGKEWQAQVTRRLSCLRMSLFPASFLALSPAARELLVAMLADDPRDRPSAAAVLRHPFITTADSSADAQREMGDLVRERMRDLAKLRCGAAFYLCDTMLVVCSLHVTSPTQPRARCGSAAVRPLCSCVASSRMMWLHRVATCVLHAAACASHGNHA
jgi:hypothetical protein